METDASELEVLDEGRSDTEEISGCCSGGSSQR